MDSKLRFVPNDYTGGNKIQVIKAIRSLTAFGLKDSKTIADNLGDNLEQVAHDCKIPSGVNPDDAIAVLRSNGIFVKSDCRQHIESLIENTKDCLSLCTENEEAELLEVYAVVFKMLMESK